MFHVKHLGLFLYVNLNNYIVLIFDVSHETLLITII